jgi:hypothetical protein
LAEVTWLEFAAITGIDRLSERIRKGVTAPSTTAQSSGWLQNHEGSNLGHTIREHVGKSDKYLMQRLQNNSNYTRVSTFTDRATAENVISKAINQNRTAVQSWLRNTTKPKYEMFYKGNDVIGRTLQQGSPVSQSATNAKVVLQRSGNSYFIKTAFPEL